MNVRRKLVVTFAGLAFIPLLVAAVTIWAMLQWGRAEAELQDHYQRSLLLQDVRALTSQASLEVPEGLSGDDPDARQDFIDTIAPARQALDEWGGLADSEDERREISEVRAAFDAVITDSRLAFDLIEAGRRVEAEQVFDERLEDATLETFQAVTQQAEEADEGRRQAIRAATEADRQTVNVMLAIAAFGALALVFLLAAYLVSDFFNPLRDIRNAMRSVRHGDHEVRLPEDRADELGDLNREFNRMTEALDARDRARPSGAALVGEEGDAGEWASVPTRVTLHAMVTEMRALVERRGSTDAADGELGATLAELSTAITRLAEFGYPLDLHLVATDVRALVYEILQRFHHELSDRAVSLELEVAPEVSETMADRLKLQEAVTELVRNAMNALPERGGRMGLRTRVLDRDAGSRLAIEVADDGVGAEQSVIDRTFDREPGSGRRPGLALVRAVVEQHGGELTIESEPGEGTSAQILLPLREPGS